MDITPQLIEQFGFPIFVCVACGYFIYKMYNNTVAENTVREERNYKVLEKFSISIEKFADVLEGYNKKLSTIEEDVKEIKEVVHK